MKTLLFFAPIGLITSNIYVWKFGDYVWTYKLSDLNVNHSLFAVLTFIIISLIAHYLIEKQILPLIILYSKEHKVSPSLKAEAMDIISKNSSKKYGFDILRKIKDAFPEYPLKIEIIEELMFWPIILILFLIALNNIIGYISLLFLFYIIFQMGKILIGIFNNYNIK